VNADSCLNVAAATASKEASSAGLLGKNACPDDDGASIEAPLLILEGSEIAGKWPA
jgi:hypothetical protein